MRVVELMKAHVVKATPDATLRDVVDQMDLYQVSVLPVVQRDDVLVGIVTERDVVDAILLPRARAAADAATISAGDVMQTSVVSVDEGAGVLEAADLMEKHRAKRLPVTCEGRLVGMIGRIDICQAILEGQIGGGPETRDE